MNGVPDEVMAAHAVRVRGTPTPGDTVTITDDALATALAGILPNTASVRLPGNVDARRVMAAVPRVAARCVTTIT